MTPSITTIILLTNIEFHFTSDYVSLVEFINLVFARMPGEDIPLVEFMYLVFIRIPGEDIPLVEFMYLVIYTHAR